MLSDDHARPALRVIKGEASSAPSPRAPDPQAEALNLITDSITQVCGDQALLLIDRKPWGHATPLPLVAIVPSGVFLIDPLPFPKSKIRVNSEGLELVVDGVLKPRVARTMDHNCDALFAAIETGPRPEVNVTPLYCLLQPRFGFFPMSVDGVDVVTLRGLVRSLKRKGDLDEHAMEAIHLDLARRFTRSQDDSQLGT